MCILCCANAFVQCSFDIFRCSNFCPWGPVPGCKIESREKFNLCAISDALATKVRHRPNFCIGSSYIELDVSFFTVKLR